MAYTKVSDLTALTSPDGAEELLVNDGGTSKKITITNATASKLPLAGGTMTGDISFGDNDKATFGASDDLQIYHDGSHSIISDSGTGAIKIKVGDFRVENASGENLIKGVGDVASLYNAGSEKLATTSTGVAITGNLELGDNEKANFGASDDLQIYHDAGGHSYIKESGSGHLVFNVDDVQINNAANTANILKGVDGGMVELYHNNSSKLATTATGIDVTGSVTADGVILDDNTTYQGIKFQGAGSNRWLALHNSSGDLIFGTGTTYGSGSEYFRIDSSGKVGIGTSSPSTALHISEDADSTITATIENKGTGTTARHLIKGISSGTGTGTKLIELQSDGNTTPVTQFVVDADGNVGIGTASPSVPLHVNTSGTSMARFVGGNDGNLYITNDSANVVTLQAASGDALSFNTNGGNERMRIDSSGNVGIGNDTPSSYDAGARQLVIGDYSSNVSAGMTISGSTNNHIYFADGTTGDEAYRGSIAYTHTTDHMVFRTAGFNERMRINSTGNVGIGDTDPSEAKLSIDNVLTGDSGLKVVRNLDEAGSNPLVYIVDDHDNNTQSALKIQQDGGSGSAGCLYVDQNGNADAIHIQQAATTRYGIYVEASSLTTGKAAYFYSASTALASTATSGLVEIKSAGDTDTNVNNLLYIHNDHADSTGTTALKVVQDSTGPAAVFDGDVDITGTVTSSGDLTLDVGEDIILDADSGNIKIYTDSSYAALLNFVTGHLVIQNMQDNADIIFKGSDDTSVITALTLDMSADGKATFKSDVVVGNGNLVIDPLAAGKGIDFSQFGAGTAAEVLDDYEEGTWTPTILGGTTAGTYTLESYRTGGVYTRVGNVVTITAVLRITSIDVAGTGTLKFGGLPFVFGPNTAPSWGQGCGIKIEHYGSGVNSSASTYPPPFVGVGGVGGDSFSAQSYGKNYMVTSVIGDLSAAYWIYTISGTYQTAT